MLRSMFIGLVIAGLLHGVGASFAPAEEVSLAAKRIDWVSVQANGLAHVLCQGYTFLTRQAVPPTH